MGHALNGSVQDTLIRYNRMRGRRVRWILGTDHAGIATQTQVERLLKREGTTREEVGREAFIERVWKWREEYGGIIFKQFQRLGASCDYEHERFTLDEQYVRAVMKVFVDLYDKGLIYRDNRIVNWDPGSRSAISDLEVEEREVTDSLYHVDYPLASGGGSITVATVRPETMLADTAIAVHPDDERYTRLVGETAILPIVGPPAADHRRPVRQARVRHGRAEDHARPRSERLRDRPRPRARGDHRHRRGRPHERGGRRGLRGHDAARGARGGRRRAARAGRARAHGALHARGAVLAPQRRADRAADLAAVVHEDGGARRPRHPGRAGRGAAVHPDSQRRRYLEWLENIRPWCISRQLWWGHQIPVWYRGEEETYVGTAPPEGDGWEQDPDVLDTWFSSGLWPFATLGWPEETPELRAFYPTDVLSTGRDILFLWVARMVMLGIEFTGELPFADVYNHSTILAPDGRRMSKSLGTGIDPLDVIDQHGADGTRFGLLAMSSTQDVRFSEEKVAQGRQLANKLFNASRLSCCAPRTAPPTARAPRRRRRRWRTAGSSPAWSARGPRRRSAIEAFEFHRAALGLYDFVYAELCDWYLEIVKPRLYADDNAEVSGFALHVLRRDPRDRPPGDPVRHGGALGARPGYGGPADGPPVSAGDPARIDPPPRRSSAARSRAIQELRGWRDRIGAAPSAVLPARLQAEGYERTMEHVARLARLDLAGANGAEPVATVIVPGRLGRRAAVRRPSTSAPRSGGSTSAARGWTPRSCGRRRSWPTRASWRRRPRRWSRPSARSSPPSGRSATACDVERGPG